MNAFDYFALLLFLRLLLPVGALLLVGEMARSFESRRYFRS